MTPLTPDYYENRKNMTHILLLQKYINQLTQKCFSNIISQIGSNQSDANFDRSVIENSGQEENGESRHNPSKYFIRWSVFIKCVLPRKGSTC